MPNRLSTINHIVVLMLENRSFDHMLGLLYSASGNVSPAGQPFEGLTGRESNPGTDGSPVAVFPVAPSANKELIFAYDSRVSASESAILKSRKSAD